MKNKLGVFLSFALIFSLFLMQHAVTAQSNTGFNVTLDGKKISFSADPININGRLLVPYRPIAEAIGAQVTYDASAKTVTVKKDSNTQLLPINAKTVKINGVNVAMDTPAILVQNQTFVPIRFVSEYLGLTVKYDPEKRSISLLSPTAPVFKILSPQPGDMMHGDKVTVSVAVFHHKLTDFKTQPQAKSGEGHVHIWLDTDATDPKIAYKLTKGDPVVFDQVKPGQHTLTVQLVGNDHKPISPSVKQVIQFTTMASAQSMETYQVNLSNYSFQPNALTIEAGSKVIFTNLDDVKHTVTADDGSFDSGIMDKGKTFEMIFSKPGVYHIHCKPHDRMVATITVK